MDDAKRILKCRGHFHVSKKQKYLDKNCFNLHSLRNAYCTSLWASLISCTSWINLYAILQMSLLNSLVYISKDVDKEEWANMLTELDIKLKGVAGKQDSCLRWTTKQNENKYIIDFIWRIHIKGSHPLHLLCLKFPSVQIKRKKQCVGRKPSHN